MTAPRPDTGRDALTRMHRASALKERIYVAFTTLAVIIALRAHDHHPTAGLALGTLAITVTATICAVYVAGLLSHMVIHEQLPTSGEHRRMIVDTFGAGTVAVPPVIAPTLGAYAGNPARGGLDSIVGASGPQLAGVIDHVRAVTGAAQVDLVGYSQGASIAGYTTKVLRPGAVGRVVSVGGYWGADNSGLIPHQLPPGLAGAALWAANLRGLAELSPGSPMLTAWYGLDRTPFLPGVAYTLIATGGDHLLPPQRSFVPGPGVGWRVPEQACGGGPTSHGGMALDPRTHSMVARALGGAGAC